MRLEDVTFTQVGGLKTACITRAELVDVIARRITAYRWRQRLADELAPMLIFDSNGQGISIANSNPNFMAILRQADLIHADGQSVVNFSRLFADHEIPERSATTDTIHDIPTFHHGPLRHFLLGGHKRVVEECAKRLQTRYANFCVAGTHDGYFSLKQEKQVLAEINRVQPDVLWVGLGKPKEQAFCTRNKLWLHVPVIITCGGCFNYVTGDYKRAPQVMQQLGLEWLHRALSEPRKLLWRYLTTSPHAIYCAYKHRIRRWAGE
ncbi:polysaccharide biosynthesis UDP-hexose transferase UppL [Bowmanella denitrificans]|uniref:Polysaccharide biosynthesis UDP-hexose transferase UppL n=1 Tax=Bowmanella denitrificans TaxID=366582 RepID=A0ABN0XHJ1_9ALTE